MFGSRNTSQIEAVCSMSKEEWLCNKMLHVNAFKIQQGAIYNLDSRSDIPDMEIPDNPSFLGTLCNKSLSSASLEHLLFRILLLLLRPRKLSDGFQMLDSIQRDCLNLKSPDNDARNILKQPEIKMSGRASALRLASADAKCMQVSNRCRFAKLALLRLAPHRPA